LVSRELLAGHDILLGVAPKTGVWLFFNKRQLFNQGSEEP
jgi:hypothetical protein